MSTTTEHETRRERTWLYVGAAVVLVLLVIIGLFTFGAAKSTKEAQQKADALIAEIEARGGQAPSRDAIVGVLGTDGGAVCANPNASLNRAMDLAMLANGAGGPGARPVIADSRAVQGKLLVIKVYCPEEAEAFQNFVTNLKTAKVAGGG